MTQGEEHDVTQREEHEVTREQEETAAAAPDGSGEEAAVHGRVKRRVHASSKNLPSAAPYVLEIVYRRGCASPRQVAMLEPGWLSESRLRRVMAETRDYGLLDFHREVLEYSPCNAALLERPMRGGRPDMRGGRWEGVYTLSEEGLRYLSGLLEIRIERLRSRYRRSYSKAKLRHGFFGSEAAAAITASVARGDARGVRLVAAETECGTGEVELPRRCPGESLGKYEPDGWLRLEDTEAPEGSRGRFHDVLLEVDTGSQDKETQIARKVNAAANWYRASLEIADRRRDFALRSARAKAERAGYGPAAVEAKLNASTPPEVLAEIGARLDARLGDEAVGEIHADLDRLLERERKARQEAPTPYRGTLSTCGVGPERMPTIVFVSSNRGRSDSVAGFVENTIAREGTMAHALHARLTAGNPRARGLRGLVCVTNLQLLRRPDGWSDAYRFLADEEPGPLI